MVLMKIFNKENNGEVVYVQMRDLKMLSQTGLHFPPSIFKKCYGLDGNLLVNSKNEKEFVLFDAEDEVAFFKSQDWIIDYEKYLNKDQKFIEVQMQMVDKQRKEIASRFNAMDFNDRFNNLNLKKYCEVKEYVYYSLKDMIKIKNGEEKIKLPQALEPKK